MCADLSELPGWNRFVEWPNKERFCMQIWTFYFQKGSFSRIRHPPIASRRKSGNIRHSGEHRTMKFAAHSKICHQNKKGRKRNSLIFKEAANLRMFWLILRPVGFFNNLVTLLNSFQYSSSWRIRWSAEDDDNGGSAVSKPIKPGSTLLIFKKKLINIYKLFNI